MEISIRESGMMISLTGKDSFGTRTETTFLATGLTGKHMEKVFIPQRMDLLTMESGKMICNKDKAKKHGLISLTLRAHISKAPSMAKGSTSTQTDQFTMAIGVTIRFLVLELILGLTRKIMKVNG